MMKLVDKAIEYAHKVHDGQVDKLGKPYIMHPLRVAGIVSDSEKSTPAMIIAALLHDVIEDTDKTYEDIETEFGEEVAALVDLLTKKPEETYKQYIERAIKDPEARAIKKADLEDNIRRLTPEIESLRPRYTRALAAIARLDK